MSEGLALKERYTSMRELCDLYGLTPRAIRFYEERGLIEPRRDRFNWRRYDGEARRRLALIATLRRADLPVDQIFDILCLAEEGPEAQARAVLSSLSKRLADLDQARETVARHLDLARKGGVEALVQRTASNEP